jgi:hypothetical protein
LHQNNLPLLPIKGQNDAHAEQRFAVVAGSGGEFPKHGRDKRLGGALGCTLQEETDISLGKGSEQGFGSLNDLRAAEPAFSGGIDKLSFVVKESLAMTVLPY